MIAIIGWGSLIWKPEQLPYQGTWQTGGPKLPLEFSRVTDERPLTLVIDPIDGVVCPARFAISSRTNLNDAIADLKAREGVSTQYIGYVDLQDEQSSLEQYSQQVDVFDVVQQWCDNNQVKAAVWTALLPNFTERLGLNFSVESAFEFLKQLPSSQQESALEYIQKTPAEIDTPLRRKVATDWAD